MPSTASMLQSSLRASCIFVFSVPTRQWATVGLKREQNLTLAKSLAQQFPKKYSVDTITEWLNLHI